MRLEDEMLRMMLGAAAVIVPSPKAKLTQRTMAGSELLPVSWTPPLSHRGDPLEFHRADIANGRVAPVRVVEPFDIVEHIGPSSKRRGDGIWRCVGVL